MLKLPLPNLQFPQTPKFRYSQAGSDAGKGVVFDYLAWKLGLKNALDRRYQ